MQTEDGVIGKVREAIDNTDKKVVSAALAELIISIQTGESISSYLILMILILIIISLLYLVIRQRKNIKC